jgi:hypothetical protein
VNREDAPRPTRSASETGSASTSNEEVRDDSCPRPGPRVRKLGTLPAVAAIASGTADILKGDSVKKRLTTFTSCSSMPPSG